MKITIESTTKTFYLNGVPARIWEGETESGVKLHCYITRVAIDKDETRDEEFRRELEHHQPPTQAIDGIPLSMVL